MAQDFQLNGFFPAKDHMVQNNTLLMDKQCIWTSKTKSLLPAMTFLCFECPRAELALQQGGLCTM